MEHFLVHLFFKGTKRFYQSVQEISSSLKSKLESTGIRIFAAFAEADGDDGDVGSAVPKWTQVQLAQAVTLLYRRAGQTLPFQKTSWRWTSGRPVTTSVLQALKSTAGTACHRAAEWMRHRTRRRQRGVVLVWSSHSVSELVNQQSPRGGEKDTYWRRSSTRARRSRHLGVQDARGQGHGQIHT